MKTGRLLITLSLIFFCSKTFAQENYQSCGINLSSISQAQGSPGDTFEIFGRWGTEQGEKIPCINKGGMNELEVLAWSESVIRVRIPAELSPGSYRVGVYCNHPSRGGTYSSGWRDFNLVLTGADIENPTVPVDTDSERRAYSDTTDRAAIAREAAEEFKFFGFDPGLEFDLEEILIGIVIIVAGFILLAVASRNRSSETLVVGTEEDVKRLLKEGQKIAAIKLYRRLKGVDLSTAKKAIEEIWLEEE